MKKISSILLIVALVVSMISILSACGESASEGLEFKSNGDGTCTWIGLGSCTDTEIVVPEENNEETVVAVAEEVLNRKEGITKVTLPNSVKELEDNALAYNNDLVEIDFGSGLEIIGKSAIANCNNLAKINLPNSLKSIGRSAFSGDSSLAEIIIPEGVETVEDYAFWGTTSVKKISIPSTMNEFSTFVFCTESLEELEIKADMKYFALDLNIDAGGNTQISGGVCVDWQKTENHRYGGICTEENLGSVICAILDKESIKLNGQKATPSSNISTGNYLAENSMYGFEITESKELIVSFGAVQKNEIARFKYSVDTAKKAIYAAGIGNLAGESINLDVTIVPLGDTLFVIMSADDEIVTGLWNKN